MRGHKMERKCVSFMKLPKDAPFAETEGLWAILIRLRDPCSDIEKRPCSRKLRRNLFHLQLLQRFPGQQFKWKGNIPVAWTRSRILSRKFQWCFQIMTQNQTTWTVTCYLLFLCVPVRSILASYWGKNFREHSESCQFAPIVKFYTSGGPGQVKMTLYLQRLVACITCHQKKKKKWPLLQPFKSTDNRLGQDSAVWHMLFPKPRFRSAPGQKRVLQQIQCLPRWAMCPADPGPGDQE